ncbi:MAG: glutamine--fructose-6-phosphate transaminase (isomerizing) [Clostridia bacterium]|nr:glutamine--fructose-6-phosphate transaminase (isomerizing) [Clostridia bacterium]
MCGIVGYIGNKKAAPILLEGLSALEYRGYDSAGIAVLENNKIITKKDKGRVSNLASIVTPCNLKGSIGIAHTRWATHGIPSMENSHPHLDNSSSFGVVHNGIIENYNDIKLFLIENGYNFLSQTDTEVIPNLIHYHFKNTVSNYQDKFLASVKSAVSELKGSYAIEVISPLFPDKIIVVRKDSPLVIGIANGENYIASDIPAILPYTKNFYFLDDNEFAVISKNTVKFYDNNLLEHKKETKLINWDASSAGKNGYDDYMLKEIYEQPDVIAETIKTRFSMPNNNYFDNLDFSKEYLESLNNIYIVACGTAMHAGLVGKNVIENLCRIPVEVDIASEFRYRNPIVNDKTLCIYISQSGETADTIAALKLAKSKGAKTLAISNVFGSSITREADYTIYTHAGPEIAVASTKAYSAQVILITIFAMYLAEVLGTISSEDISKLKLEITELPKKLETILNDTTQIKKFAKIVCTEKDMFFLGRNIDYCTALEGSLKLKEISYIHSEAYASGELKHGPIALIENGITVIGIITNPELVEKSLSNIQEVITRGAKTLVITNQSLPNNNIDNIIKIPETHPLLAPILSIIPLQLLSYYIAKSKELDVDKPRNLAKSVTVE